jgi:hypothetical protein
MQKAVYLLSTFVVVFLCAGVPASGPGNGVSEGKRRFECETFGGNGRTCRTVIPVGGLE